MFVKNGTGELKKVLVSRPEYLKPAPINEIAKKWKDTTMDVDVMLREHEEFVKSYEDAGVEVEFLDADDERPNSVFARDFGGCVKEGYILGNFKLDMRYKEHVDYEKRMAELGIPKIGEVKNGLFEGGDFMFMSEKWVAVGMADRTDEEGLKELKAILEPLGYEVTGVPLKKEYLHLDMCFNLVDDHLAVAYVDGLPEEFKDLLAERGIELIPVPEEAIFLHGCNLQALGNHTVLSLKQNKKVNEELVKRGMKVIEMDITEILKAGGGPHCMTFPLVRI
ncbi:N-Dimethylarginine dimethylaminohydrolase [Pseudobutyrivibrio sp. 49]|uniref:dimethylarginine dimethylaminohydrolase family protein n=1 Tax=Pseudobutyrivibrio sp. 49 TaxID=1855344 RepID=UPI000881257A|nr:arginine deiminase family protein [Pseudobutyrivibrio sp. 49]SDI59432.1 N-Dimethylarginine dimethylaminohydrolase [Pseudobutyrivibrio sp. 49]